MDNIIRPWQFMLVALAGWVNRDQQAIIEYLKEENKILREQFNGKRPKLNDDQRRRLARRGKSLGRKMLGEIATIVTPDTILAWHRKLIARHWTSRRKGPGRPYIKEEIAKLIVKMALENPLWGYTAIRDRLRNLDHDVCRTTVANVLRENGLEPTPQRRKKTSWKTFIKSHWEVLAAIDFTTVDVWSPRGLLTYYVLFAMDLVTRRVHLVGITLNPHEAWMKQMARNLTDAFDGFLKGKRYVIMDRDDKFTAAFRSLLGSTGLRVKRIPARSPNCNAHIERFIRSIKEECLHRLVLFGEGSLHRAISEYLMHFHSERNHQGLDSRLIDPPAELNCSDGDVTRRDRLGGVLRFYYREAA